MSSPGPSHGGTAETAGSPANGSAPLDPARRDAVPHVDLLEPGLDGGVHNHAWALAGALADTGVPVTLHCAHSASPPVPMPQVDICRCVWWAPRNTPKAIRNAATAARFMLWTVPHLLSGRQSPTVLHVQGLWRTPLFAWLMLMARLRRRPVVHTPHNTFSRDNAQSDRHLLPWMARRAQASIVFSEPDRATVEGWGGRPVRSKLLHIVPKPTDARLTVWRERLQGDGEHTVVLFAGQLRPDKGLVDLVEAASGWPADWRLAVVGSDVGGLAEAMDRAHQLGVDVTLHEGYLPLDDFAGAIAAADVVVCPYHVASQSGVLDFARRLGTPAVASSVGGLGELADATFPPRDPNAINAALESVLAKRRPSDRRSADPEISAIVATHVTTYVSAVND